MAAIGKDYHAGTEGNPPGVHPSRLLISTSLPAASILSALLSRACHLARSQMLSTLVVASMSLLSPGAVRNSSIFRWICNARSLRLVFTLHRLGRNRKVRSASISASIHFAHFLPLLRSPFLMRTKVVQGICDLSSSCTSTDPRLLPVDMVTPSRMARHRRMLIFSQ